MDWRELTGDLPTAAEAVVTCIKLAAAMIAGGILGIERQQAGKEAGLRTHMLVCIGSCLFVLSMTHSGSAEAVSRVIQGVATGIGFVGGGAILKLSSERDIKGLTTAANIWLTAALGVCIGTGRLWAALFGTLIAWFTLSVLERAEKALNAKNQKQS